MLPLTEDQDLLLAFQSGRCHHLALAFRDQLGLPLGAILDDLHHPLHVFAWHGDHALDASGLSEEHDLVWQARFKGHADHPQAIVLKEGQLEGWIARGWLSQPSPEDLEEAQALVSRFRALQGETMPSLG
jgi:hypothetical protein